MSKWTLDLSPSLAKPFPNKCSQFILQVIIIITSIIIIIFAIIVIYRILTMCQKLFLKLAEVWMIYTDKI